MNLEDRSTGEILFACVFTVLWLGAVGTSIYVVAHFVIKYW